MGAHRFWRITITGVASATNCGFAEIELRETPGGVDMTMHGISTASSQIDGSHGALNAIDGSVATEWISYAATGHWAHDFGAGRAYDVVEVAITAPADPTRAPRDFEVAYSDDLASWVHVQSFAGVVWTANQVRTFTLGGSNEDEGASSFWVTFDGMPATEVVLLDADTIQCRTPAHAVGVVAVRAEFNDGATLTEEAAYAYEVASASARPNIFVVT